jgi:Cof subfamily protein (haloacid dehalogenase superfamily)
VAETAVIEIVDESGKTRRVIEAVWRIESPKLIARLARMVDDVGLAEDLAQDALVIALKQWPKSGIPENPGAWLMAAAKNRAIDQLRRAKRLERKHEQIAHDLHTREGTSTPEVEDEREIGDDLLRLMFTTCHPALSTQARVALTLRLLGGLRTDEIARAFLVSEPTIAQRIVRAKRVLAEAHVQFELPNADELSLRVESVCETVYLIFNEGYSASAGDRWMRPELCGEALRLGRILAGLTPEEPEVHGLVALMEIQMSRFAARVDPTGKPVLLLDQDRKHWDRLLAGRGLAALRRAERLSAAYGPYMLQAAIAACHTLAHTARETDWRRIAVLYDALARLRPSPVVELNRAVAVGMAFGPAVGLELVDALRDEPVLANYHLLPSVRADLLAKLGRREEAHTELRRALALTRNASERALLVERATALAWTASPQLRAARSCVCGDNADMAQSPIRIVLADVDGTLVTPEKVLTDRAVAAVKRLRELGIEFAVTSGRPPRGMSMLIEPLGLSTPISAFNGGLVVRPDMSVLEQKTIPASVAPAAIELLLAAGLDVWVYRGADWLLRDAAAPHVDREASTVRFDPTTVEDFNGVTDVAKIVGVSDDHELMAATTEKARATFGEHVSAAQSQPYYLDITHPRANKGEVVKYLSARLRIPTDQFATIGDMPNDVLMFAHSGLSIAMGNAGHEVQRAARKVTASNEHDGFAEAIERFVLGGIVEGK